MESDNSFLQKKTQTHLVENIPLPSFIPETNSLNTRDEIFKDKNGSNIQINLSKSNIHWLKVFFISFLKLILFYIVGKLSWECNQKNNIFLRLIFTFFSIIFSEIYIIYYAIYRTFMGNTCPV